MKTAIRKATDPKCDADTLTVALDNGGVIRVYAYVNRAGVPVVAIDPDPGTGVGLFRVEMQDVAIWEGTW